MGEIISHRQVGGGMEMSGSNLLEFLVALQNSRGMYLNLNLDKAAQNQKISNKTIMI